ncbi:hypothetical protein ALQ06_02261 [Pseudomonas syringae pv. berberidis]|nr:hypothetical protein ALQ06_02261 [Pseudomonas syringae pv. berberidis]
MRLSIVEQGCVLGLLHQLQSFINEAIHKALAEAMLVQLNNQIGVFELPGALSRWQWLSESEEFRLKEAGHLCQKGILHLGFLLLVDDFANRLPVLLRQQRKPLLSVFHGCAPRLMPDIELGYVRGRSACNISESEGSV